MSLFRAGVVGAIAAGLTLAACQWVAGLKHPDDEPRATGAPDAANEAADGDAAEGVLAVCDPIPTRVQAPTLGTGAHYFVFQYATLDVSKPPEEFRGRLCAPAAANLDGLDTCGADNKKSACLPLDPASPPCDGPAGADNAVAALIQKLSGVPVAERFTQTLEPSIAFNAGLLNLIISIKNYNGEKDDYQVDVELMLSAGLPSVTTQIGSAFDIASADPVWDGGKTDWVKAVNEKQQPYASVSDLAYVANGILVADFSEALLPLAAVYGPELTMHRAKMVARLVVHDGEYHLERGHMFGSIPSQGLLQALGGVQGKGFPVVCKDDSLFKYVAGLVCEQVDISPSGGGVCEELSVGFGFIAVPANQPNQVGPPRINPPPPCDGGWTAPACDFIAEYRSNHPDAGNDAPLSD